MRRFVLIFALRLLAACSSPAAGTPDARPSAVDAAPVDPNAPPASAGHALVYAADLQRVLLVNAGLGGATPPPASTPTRIWTWSGSRWELVDEDGPPTRNLAGVDHDGERLVIHGGGYSAELSYGETWAWTSTGGWHQLTGPGPGVRDHTQMVYDRTREVFVLFGGQTTVTSFPADTWELDGESWHRRDVPGPPPRVHHTMAFDGQRVVVFGGVDGDGDTLGDTWAWDGETWTTLARATAPRSHARMVRDPTHGLIVVGGFESSLGAVRLDGDSWVALSVSPAPSARYLTAAAAAASVTVLFGGGDPQSSDLFADTWELDATTWRRR